MGADSAAWICPSACDLETLVFSPGTCRRIRSTLGTRQDASYIEDFCILSECDILISGSSTFALAAGFVGKEKKIIHSEKFVNQFRDSEEKWYSNFRNGLFFKDLLNKPNKYYPLLKLI